MEQTFPGCFRVVCHPGSPKTIIIFRNALFSLASDALWDAGLIVMKIV